MKYRYSPPYRSFAQPLGGQSQGQSPYPGISDPFQGGFPNTSGGAGPFEISPLQSTTPGIVIQPASGLLPAGSELVESVAGSGSSGKSGSKLANSLNDLKGMIDRLGGVDGIVNTMQKVQKVVGSLQQMAPLLKVLADSFGKKKAAASADDDLVPARPRRRKRRTGASSQQRRRARRRKRR
ncbi:hypothetical protein [Paenibacillus humicola]|uniref:hypothetical protein n=1 Tax=Paenibacillus humicola TaxID=3110540 RepID=UPI00237B10F2|nr:hypothetical protein [Paenibacillus humicola]